MKHVHTGIPPSCWDRCEASVIGVEQRLLCLPISVEKKKKNNSSYLWFQLQPLARRLVQISAGFQAKTVSSWPCGCGSCSAVLFCSASCPEAAPGWSPEPELPAANRQTLLWRGPDMMLPSPLVLFLGARSCRVPEQGRLALLLVGGAGRASAEGDVAVGREGLCSGRENQPGFWK